MEERDGWGRLSAASRVLAAPLGEAAPADVARLIAAVLPDDDAPVAPLDVAAFNSSI